MRKDLKGKRLPKGIVQRSDGRYMGRFTFAGERYTLYEDNSPAKLKKAMEDLRYELEHGLVGKAKKIIVDKFFQSWLEDYKGGTIKETTRILYRNYYEWYIKKTLGKKQVSDVSAIHVQRIVRDMEKDGKSISTIGKVYSILYDIMNYALICDLIIKNPCIGVRVPKEQENRERRVLSAAEQKIFINAIKGSYYEDFYIVALGTGMRINEILALTWDDIDFNKEVIHINKTLAYISKGTGEKGYLQFQKPKTKAGKRDIPILPRVKVCLKKHKSKQYEDRIKYKGMRDPQEGMENLVFTSETGKPIHDRYIRKNLKCIVDKINKEEKINAEKENRKPVIFKDMTPHTLRHSFATRAFENGMKPKAVQEILGHGSLAMTMDLYTHVTDDTKRKEMDKLKNII